MREPGPYLAEKYFRLAHTEMISAVPAVPAGSAGSGVTFSVFPSSCSLERLSASVGVGGGPQLGL